MIAGEGQHGRAPETVGMLFGIVESHALALLECKWAPLMQ